MDEPPTLRLPTPPTPVVDTVDVGYALELLRRLGPGLAREERALRAAAPSLADDDVREAALRTALVELGATVSRRTFVYLRWKLDRAGPTASAGEAASPSPASRPVDARTAVEREARTLRVPRLMCDALGTRWVVSEVEPLGPADAAGERCLLFTQARDRRRQPVYPESWRSLPNDALSALLPPSGP